MAQKVTVLLVDDIDGKNADETVTFGLDGASYEIDLSAKNAKALRAALQTYIDAGRKVGRSGSANRAKKSSAIATSGPTAAEIRAWAQANGHKVPDRGRIPADVREAYDSAN